MGYRSNLREGKRSVSTSGRSVRWYGRWPEADTYEGVHLGNRWTSLRLYVLEGIHRRPNVRISFPIGIRLAIDPTQRPSGWTRKDRQGFEVRARERVSGFPSFSNGILAKEPGAMGLAKTLARSRQSRCDR